MHDSSPLLRVRRPASAKWIMSSLLHPSTQEAAAYQPPMNALWLSFEALAKEDRLRRILPKKPERPLQMAFLAEIDWSGAIYFSYVQGALARGMCRTNEVSRRPPVRRAHGGPG